MITKLKYAEGISECPIKFMNGREFNKIREKIIVVLKPSTCELYMITSRDQDQNGYTYTLTKIYVGMNSNSDLTALYFRPEDLLDNNEFEIYMLDRLSQLKDIPNIEYYS